MVPMTQRAGRRRGASAAAGLLCLVGALVPAPAAPQAVKGNYLFTLSSFTGPIRQDWSRIALDRPRREAYAVYQNSVRVFNEFGMEVYRFGDDLDVGRIVDVAVDDAGDIFVLAYRETGVVIMRCDYRGRPRGEVGVIGAPDQLSGFAPNRIVYQGGRLYLVSTMGLVAVTVDTEGRFLRSYDLFKLLEIEEKDRASTELGGFSVDDDGNMLMTVPVLFRAFIVAPNGSVDIFGKPGGGPGKFNITGGIARDRKGNILVVDRLKGGVLVFNRQLNYVTQFSTRGYRAGELIFPDDLAVDDRNNVFITQAGRRGISVFRLAYP
jgi:hypothetical protein